MKAVNIPYIAEFNRLYLKLKRKSFVQNGQRIVSCLSSLQRKENVSNLVQFGQGRLSMMPPLTYEKSLAS